MAGYIDAHLRYAGVGHALFADPAIDAIFHYSGGAARLINKACTHSLLYAAQNNHRLVDETIVTRVIKGELA